MRMTDTLGKISKWEESSRFTQYRKSFDVLSEAVGNVDAGLAENWDLLFDNHQYSTQEAGKSSCVFLFKAFDSMEDALLVLNAIHAYLPKVNIELQVLPDGHSDFGDGGGSYSFAALRAYLPMSGRWYCLLVDAQNLLRHA